MKTTKNEDDQKRIQPKNSDDQKQKRPATIRPGKWSDTGVTRLVYNLLSA